MQLTRLAGTKSPLPLAPTAALIVALGLVAPAFAQDTAATPVGGSSTVERIRSAGKVTLGYYAEARPLSFRNNTGDADGYGPAICKLVVADLQKELNVPGLATQFVGVEGNDRFAAVKEGRIDLLCGPAEETLARRAEVSFSIAVMDSGTSVMLRKDAPDALHDVLAGREARDDRQPLWRGSPQVAALQQRTFAVVTGTTTENRIKEARERLKVRSSIVSVPDLATAIRQVSDGSADAFFGERTTLLHAIQHDASAGKLTVLDRYFDHTPLSFALARGDEDFRLMVDKSLSHLYGSGRIAEVYTQFFGKPDGAAISQFDRTALRDA
jgi:polar amino acid transport system substrate-binding protein